MNRRGKRLLAEFAIALAVCGVVAFLDRALIGLAGAVLCSLVFGARMLMAPLGGNARGTETHDETATVLSKSEHNITGLVPHTYKFGNPVYYPEDDPPHAQGR